MSTQASFDLLLQTIVATAEGRQIFGKKKKEKKKKTSHNNWFEKCDLNQLKQLCKASGLKVSGTKKVVCDRLCLGDLSRPYAYEYARERFSRARMEHEMYSHDGYRSGGEYETAVLPPAQQGSKRDSAFSMDSLKEMCRNKGLIVSGKRVDLVLRLLQNESGKGGSPKRAAGTLDEEGNFQPKKRAKTMTLPNSGKIKERAFKKACPSMETKRKWSNNKHKEHGNVCVEFASNIIEKEIFEKELFERGEEKLAWEVINAVLYYIIHGDKERERAHYAEHTGQMCFAICTKPELGRAWSISTLFSKLIRAMKATSSNEKLKEFGEEVLRGLQHQAALYCEKDGDFHNALDENFPNDENTTN